MILHGMLNGLRTLLLAMDNSKAHGEVFNLAGSHTYSGGGEPD